MIDKYLLGFAYDRLAGWFKYMETTIRRGVPSEAQIEQLAEIKATRDVLIHSNGIANAIYVSKSMGPARVAVGETLPVPAYYHRQSWELIRKVVSDIADTAIAKVQ